jgi:hypothetical protein
LNSSGRHTPRVCFFWDYGNVRAPPRTTILVAPVGNFRMPTACISTSYPQVAPGTWHYVKEPPSTYITRFSPTLSHSLSPRGYKIHTCFKDRISEINFALSVPYSSLELFCSLGSRQQATVPTRWMGLYTVIFSVFA